MSLIRRRRFGMPANGYHLVAEIIRRIDDPAIKQKVADHFGTEFNKRSTSFDPYQWEKATGGKVAPNSAASR